MAACFGHGVATSDAASASWTAIRSSRSTAIELYDHGHHVHGHDEGINHAMEFVFEVADTQFYYQSIYTFFDIVKINIC
uniref:Uncharacterized protein n=1 Tax=Aegilops tauschii TaxID=37682 RepID=M8B636_AEGTA